MDGTKKLLWAGVGEQKILLVGVTLAQLIVCGTLTMKVLGDYVYFFHFFN
jgi:hypothetical protein